MENEHSLFAAFLKREKRDRYREILSNPRLRCKFIEQLANFRDFDSRYRVSIPSTKLFADNAAVQLRKRFCPNVVYAISEDPVGILERNGIYVKKIRTERPGNVLYEDEWQLVAEPFRIGTMSRR